MDVSGKIRGLISKHSLSACAPTGGAQDWSRVSVSDDEHLPLAHGVIQKLEADASGLVLNLITAHGKPVHSEILQDVDDNSLVK